MLIVGLTGGIGCGKSTVAKLFQTYGYPVYDSDSQMKALYDSDDALKDEMRRLFGKDIFKGPQQRLDRAALAGIVFQDTQALRQLEAVAHPALVRHFLSWADGQSRKGASMVLFESAILTDRQLDIRFDSVIAVSAPEEVCIERVGRRSGLRPEEVRQRMRRQQSPEALASKADHQVDNGGALPLIPQIEHIIEVLTHKPVQTSC